MLKVRVLLPQPQKLKIMPKTSDDYVRAECPIEGCNQTISVAKRHCTVLHRCLCQKHTLRYIWYQNNVTIVKQKVEFLMSETPEEKALREAQEEMERLAKSLEEMMTPERQEQLRKMQEES